MSNTLDTVKSCPVQDINPMDPQLLKCPAVMNFRLREEAPVFQDPNSGIFFISRYEDVVKVAMDAQTFSSRRFAGGQDRGFISVGDEEVDAVRKQGYEDVATMLTQDPPLQRRYRKFVDGAFSPASLQALEPFIENTANQLIDAFIGKGHCDFLEAFAVPLPLRVIVDQLGAPLEDLPLFRKWTEAYIGVLSQQLDRDGHLQAAADIVEFQHYFVEKMNERRESPKNDILSKIVNARVEDDKTLDDAEGLSMISQILVAGNETTSASLAEGIWLLIQNPDQYAIVQQDQSPAMISNLVEEVLRVTSPSANMIRRTTRDVELNGVLIPENSFCFVRFASANQDDAQFADAAKFNILRENLKDHVAFGKGVHHCLGAALSRREMNIGFRIIFERMKNFRLSAGANPPEFSANVLLHGLTGLDLSFDRV